jgi:hypothetical protein
MELYTAGGRPVDGDGTMPVFSAYSLACYTAIVQAIAESTLERPLDLESLLDRAALREEQSFPLEALSRWKTLSSWNLWPIEGSKSVEALTLTLT